MTDDRYVILDVTYTPHLDYGRSLKWIAPELAGCGIELTEDNLTTEEVLDPTTFTTYPHKKWAGIIKSEYYDKLVAAWTLDESNAEDTMGMITELGHLPAIAFQFDGTDWNMGGESPILFASLWVSPALYRDIS